jgi:hypothetical protein
MEHDQLTTFVKVPPDSPRALTRVLTIAMVSDGRVDPDEVAALDRIEAHARLGLGRDAFFREVEACCALLLARAAARQPASIGLDDPVVQQWISAVRRPEHRRTVLLLAFELIRSDRELHPAESRVFWALLDAWGYRLDEVRAARWAVALAADAMGAPPPPKGGRAPRVFQLPKALVVA